MFSMFLPPSDRSPARENNLSVKRAYPRRTCCRTGIFRTEPNRLLREINTWFNPDINSFRNTRIVQSTKLPCMADRVFQRAIGILYRTIATDISVIFSNIDICSADRNRHAEHTYQPNDLLTNLHVLF